MSEDNVEEYGADWSRIDAGGAADAPLDTIEARPPDYGVLWTRIDAGLPGEPVIFDLIDGRPPEKYTPKPVVFYEQLDATQNENRVPVTPFTKLWYSFLPSIYKEQDEFQNEADSGWPMLRFMDAPGHIPDNIRATLHDMREGKWTNPSTVPDRAVPWLASVLGVPRSQKNVPLPQLRQALIDMVENGRAPTGTRAELANVAKQFLVGTKEVVVKPQVSLPRALTDPDLAVAAAVGYAGRVVAVHIGREAPIRYDVDDLWIDEDNGDVYTLVSGTWTKHTGSDVSTLANAAIAAREDEKIVRAHTIVIMARPDDIPGGDLVAFAANLRSVGLVPAGHTVMIVTAQASWDSFEAELSKLGGSWAQYESATRTWADDEALGLNTLGGEA